MSNRFIVLIESDSESPNMTGIILNVKVPPFRSDDLDEIMEWANLKVKYHLKDVGKEYESYSVIPYFGLGLVHKKRLNDPEISIFTSIASNDSRQCEISFDSATQFAKIAINSLVLLNGGAVIAVLTFFGNLIQRLPIRNIDNLSLSLYAYIFGLIGALLAATAGYICQNRQTIELSRGLAESSLNFMTALNLTKVTDTLKRQLETRFPQTRITSGTVRTIAVILAVISLTCFSAGSYCALQSLRDNIFN